MNKRVGNPVEEAVRGRLRHAIVAEDGDEEQLDGARRAPAEDRLPLFGNARAEHCPG